MSVDAKLHAVPRARQCKQPTNKKTDVLNATKTERDLEAILVRAMLVVGSQLKTNPGLFDYF